MAADGAICCTYTHQHDEHKPQLVTGPNKASKSPQSDCATTADAAATFQLFTMPFGIHFK
jgi:hypothetical protein